MSVETRRARSAPAKKVARKTKLSPEQEAAKLEKSRRAAAQREEKSRAAEEKKRRTAAEKEDKRRATEEKRRATEEKRRATQEKRRATEEKRRATEEKRRATQEKRAAAEAKARQAAEEALLAVEKAQNPDVFVEALTKARSKTNQLLKLDDVKKQVELAVQKPFVAHWKRRVESGEVPPGVGTLVVKSGQTSGRRVFLLSDVVPSATGDGAVRPRTASSAKTSPKLLKERMLSEFDRLNAKSDGRYYVSLFDLRGALDDVSRNEFDAALNELRRDWVLTLSPAEGRHEVVPSHILDAGVLEQSRLLVYVTRRES